MSSDAGDPKRSREEPGEKDEGGRMKDEPNRNHLEAPSPVDKLTAQLLEAQVIEALRTVFDPEIPVNIYDLGLVYGIDLADDGVVHVRMTLTSPACPVAESLPPQVSSRVKALDGVADCRVEIVWDPPWSPDRMSEAAKLELGLF